MSADPSSPNSSTAADGFGLDPWLEELQSEWEGKEPNVNFYVLLASLLLTISWMVFISFYFSRLLGIIGNLVLKWLLRWSGVGGVNHFSVGSLSISFLSG